MEGNTTTLVSATQNSQLLTDITVSPEVFSPNGDDINDLREIAGSDDVIVEAIGDSYSEFARISGSSGVPTVIGWVFHERQWRGTDELFVDREMDVRTIYTTRDIEELQSLIDKYQITMVVLGPRERATYDNIVAGMFDRLGDRVIEHGLYTVFSID